VKKEGKRERGRERGREGENFSFFIEETPRSNLFNEK
jgi:hypothetical protein